MLRTTVYPRAVGLWTQDRHSTHKPEIGDANGGWSANILSQHGPGHAGQLIR
jgi:hypothetical protein